MFYLFIVSISTFMYHLIQLYDRAKLKLSPLKYFTATHTVPYVICFFSWICFCSFFLSNLFAKLFSFSYTCLTSCSYLLPCCNISASPAWKYFQLPSFISKFLTIISWVMFRSCTPVGPGWVWTLKALCFWQLPGTFGPLELLCLCCVGPFW